MLNVASVLRQLSASIDRLDARLLLQKVLAVTHSYLIAHPEREVTQEQWQQLKAQAARRLAGEPLAYILEEAEFFGLRLWVNSAVLVPRPDTELLVELALQKLKDLQKNEAGAAVENSEPVVLDLGTGSGAIPLAIKHSLPSARVIGLDVSTEALFVAKRNAEVLGLSIEWLQSNWFGNLPADLKVDVLLSNPPYIAAGDPHLQGDGLRYEPVGALTDGGTGLSALQHIVDGAPCCLKVGGWLMLEHGYDQASAVRSMLQARFERVESWRDLAGIERVSGGCFRVAFV